MVVMDFIIAYRKRGRDMDKELLLTITMLVSNREDTIEKCMESIKPLLDSVPSELIVVDTAGNEKCMEIVRRYTRDIVRFQWCNDFAAARNAGLCKAKGAWVMYMDDDEWFEDISEIRDFFLDGTYQHYASAAYLTRNYMDRQGIRYQDRVAVRLCRRDKNTCFKGRVHEQLYPLYEPAYYMKAYVHHYGYVYNSAEEKREHSWRNIRLLIEAREAEKDNWQAGAHLIQEYYGVGEYYSLIAVAREIRLQKDSYSAERNDFTSYASIKEMDAYLKLKRYEEAYAVGKELLNEKKAQLLCHMCIAAMMPDVCLKLKKYQEILSYIELFHKYQEEWEKDSDKYAARDAFSVHREYLNEDRISKINMIELHIRVKNQEWREAEECFLKIGWLDTAELLSNTFGDIISLLLHVDYRKEYAIALEILLKGEGSRQYLCNMIDKLQGEEKEKIFYCISQIPSGELKILEYRIQYAILLHDVPGTCQLLDEWKENNYSFFLPDKQYWKGLKELQINLSDWLENVRIHEWITLSEALFEQMEEEDCENIYQVLIRGLEKTDIRFLYLTALRLEKRLLLRNMKLENLDYPDMEEIWNELYRIASLWVSCAAMLYQEHVFQSELQSALPARYQFSWLIFQANAVKADTRSFVRKIAEAAKAYLKMEEVCKYLLRCCKTEAEQESIELQK